MGTGWRTNHSRFARPHTRSIRERGICMEIYFDKATRKILRYIKWHPKAALQDIHNKLGKDIDMQLINLCQSDYVACTRADGSFTSFKTDPPWHSYSSDKFWLTPKGKKVLEDRFDRLWQWCIPTIISFIALAISIISTCYPGVIKVLLLE